MTGSISNATQRISLNPLEHFRTGAGPFVKTNLGAAVIAILLSAVANTVLSAAFLYLIGSQGFALKYSQPSGGGLVMLILAVAALAILAALIVGLFGSIVNRLILTGSRGQKVDFSTAFKFVAKRLTQIVFTYLLVLAIFIGGIIVISALTAISPILGVMLFITGIVAAIVFALRILYIPLVLIDDNYPGKPMDVIKRSSALWHKSQGALVIYVLVWLVIYAVFSIFLNGSNSYLPGASSPSPGIMPGAFSFAIGSALLSSLLSNIFSTLVYVGETSIYNDASKLVDGPAAAEYAAPRAPTA